MPDTLKRCFNRYFPLWAYGVALLNGAATLAFGADMGLFPMPSYGTDQLSMLTAAAGICHGQLPEGPYGYSPAYTLLLSLLAFISLGNILVMRLLQTAICALIPVLVFKIALRLRLGREASQIAALCYCSYGPAILMSLDFLREAPLGLCFAAFTLFLLKACSSRKLQPWSWTGLFAGLCVLGRENFIPIVLLPLALVCLTRWRGRRGMRQLALYAAMTILVLSPVLAYNSLRFGSCSIVPGHVGNVLGAYHGQKAVESSRAAFASIAENIPRQVGKFLSSYELPNSLSYYANRDVSDFLRVLPIPFNLLVALAAACAALRWHRKGTICVALLVAAYVGTMSFFEMFYRFRIPVAPLVCVLSGGGVVLIARNLGNVKGIAAAAAVIGLVLLTYTSPEKLRTAGERLAVANVLISNGRLAQAEEYLSALAATAMEIIWTMDAPLEFSRHDQRRAKASAMITAPTNAPVSFTAAADPANTPNNSKSLFVKLLRPYPMAVTTSKAPDRLRTRNCSAYASDVVVRTIGAAAKDNAQTSEAHDPTLGRSSIQSEASTFSDTAHTMSRGVVIPPAVNPIQYSISGRQGNPEYGLSAKTKGAPALCQRAGS